MALSKLSCSITEAGIYAPTYDEILAELKARLREYYGQDIDLDPSGADGQMVALWALAIHESNNSTIACYNSFSPATAIGNGLSSVVKVNGITRQKPSKSYVDLRIVGQTGTNILNGRVLDVNDNRWILPDSVVIPHEGEITVTAEAEEDGAIIAGIGEVNRIATPVLGWQSVTNPAAARTGKDVETDYDLRVRQQLSVTLSARTVSDGIVAGLLSLNGVKKAIVYENDTTITDEHGIPPHCIYSIVDGGETQEIAEIIAAKKSLGVGTHGEISQTVTDDSGVTKTIKFSRPVNVPIYAHVKIAPLNGYLYSVGDSIKQAIADYINEIGMGNDVVLVSLYCPATLHGYDYSTTFKVESLEIGKSAGDLKASDIEIDINQQPICTAENVTVELDE